MPFHISLIACAHREGDMARIREELAARAIEIWAAPGVVAVAPLVDAGKCGVLTTWQDAESFRAWQQRISHSTLRAFLSRLSHGAQFCFDCAFQEADVAPPSQAPADPPRMAVGAVVPWHRPVGC